MQYRLVDFYIATKFHDVKIYLLTSTDQSGIIFTMEKDKEKSYINTTIQKGIHKSLRVLAAQEGVRVNALLEEAIEDLLVKYEAQEKKTKK